MLVFVDESGDQGVQNKPGSSSLFVMSAVIFVDGSDAYDCASRVSELRRKLLPSADAEFKFNKCSRSKRCQFIAEVAQCDFLYVAAGIDKNGLMASELQMQDPFYRFACKLLFDVAKPYIRNSSITIDGGGERRFRLQLQNYLRSKINSELKIIRQVKIEDSKSNNLLQVADMVCGAVARSFREDKQDRFEYRRLLYKKELEVVIWPKK